MKLLERNFLEKMARSHSLSADQEEVFLMRFAEGMKYDEIIKNVQTSRGACLKRMGNVYKKFAIKGDSRGKETKLRHFLIEEYEKNKHTFNNNKDSGLLLESTIISSDIFQQPPDGEIIPNTNYPFYIERSPLEQICYQEIEKQGAFIRIKAAPKMGKTSLKLRILAHSQNIGYSTVNLDLKQVDTKTLQNLDRFLKWISINVSKQLGKLNLANTIESSWLDILGSITNCLDYFENLLFSVEKPVVISFDCLEDIAFISSEIYQDFLKFLRSLYEQTKLNPNFQKLKLIIIHSTSIYSSFNINHSPFSVGKELLLSDFDNNLINDLAKKYKLDWNELQEKKLRTFCEGHPFFVQLTLYHLAINESLTLENIFKDARENGGIYKQYLQGYFSSLGQDLELLSEFKKVLLNEYYKINRHTNLFKLHSMGLVKLVGLNEVTIALPLYQEYFSKQLLS